ncbi:MAG: hypothetical protein JSS99_14595 [Actinobacteria bacterium]|nr:hypothetical protein [Actinomycetota bacterium]
MDEELSGPRLPRDHPLAGCEAKIWRAHEHFERLKKEIRDLGSGEFHPATFRTEQKPHAKDTFQTVVETVNEPPLEISTIIGDVVHNLRSTLDHLVFELSFLGLGGRVPRKRTAFPGSLTRENWHRPEVQTLMLHGVMQKHRAMLYRAQPCYRRKDNPSAATLRRRGRHPAADLQHLWNEDKHRIIQLVAVAPYEIAPRIVFHDCTRRGDPTIHLENLGQRLDVGAEILTVPVEVTGPNPKVDVQIEILCQVCLGNGLPVRYALAQIAGWVETVIQSFEPVFETPQARRLWGLPRGSWVESRPLTSRRKSTSGWRLVEGHAAPPTG